MIRAGTPGWDVQGVVMFCHVCARVCKRVAL